MGSESPKNTRASHKLDDVVLVYGKTDDGKGYDVLRQRDGEIQAGTMRPLDHGKPIHGEVVQLTPRDGSAVLFDVEVQHDARPSTGRPAKVATERYRKGWESIWSKERDVRELN